MLELSLCVLLDMFIIVLYFELRVAFLIETTNCHHKWMNQEHIESRQNTNQMLSQMSADMWQVPEPDEEAAVAAARLRAKEEHERVQAEQARLQEEAAQAVRDAEAARQRSEAAKAAAEAAREAAERLAAQMQTDATQLTAMMRLEQQKAATRKDAKMVAQAAQTAVEHSIQTAMALSTWMSRPHLTQSTSRGQISLGNSR